ncbi:unnamed protein product [Linum trigynum]|uniref:Uncharacterized protein n=1 Tax=Linum trigynum TaxID=586398 RepID=A0AAV2DP20_9ROSI
MSCIIQKVTTPEMAINTLGAVAYTVGDAMLYVEQTFKTCKAKRGLMGVGLGVGRAIGPIYIAEISLACHRGFLGSIS